MNLPVPHPGLLQIAAGYVTAVLVASGVTAAVIAIEARDLSLFLLAAMVGSVWTSVLALPGFLLTVLLANRLVWTGWAWFTIAGGLTAVLAWLLVGGADATMIKASMRGGAAGGVSYWWTAYHALPRLRLARARQLR